jgi:transketolase
MRTAFIQTLIEEARRRDDVFLVVGDLGFSVIEPFAAEFPDRYLNAGVAEQNMTGVAAGLASEGWHVFTYSIANFPTLRCFEQIRNDVCYHQLPVTVVAVGAGMSYGSLGYSHHAVQDIAVMRTLPNITVLSPADPGEARESVQWLCMNPGPSYLRIGKAGEPHLHDVRGIASGPLLVLPGSGSTALVATGSVLKVALEAAQLARERGTSPPVFSCPWLAPGESSFFKSLSAFRRLITLEEHVSAGGFASLLREHLPNSVEVVPMCIPHSMASAVGSQQWLRDQAGFTPQAIIERLGY